MPFSGGARALPVAWSLLFCHVEMTTFFSRFIGAALLRPETYEDVEADHGALGQAIVVVLLSSIAAGVGSWGAAAGRPIVLAVIVVLALVVWSVWAYLTYEIGARLMPTERTQADVGQLLRTLGFASAPGVLRVFGIIPGATTPVFAVTELWMLMAMIVAIRQALDYTSTARAAAVCALSWVLAVALGLVIGTLSVPGLS
jgi:hypothetical protein